MFEKRLFNGGLDKDSEVRFVQQGDWRDALNIQAGVTSSDSFGAIEKVLGNEEVPRENTEEGDVCIGAYDDKTNKKVYAFICNTLDETKHRVIRINYADPSISFQIDTIAESAALNFSTDYLITGINVVDNMHLYWTDDLNEPSKMYLPEADKGFYLSQQERQYFDAIPHAPLIPPIVEYGSDDQVKFNLMQNNLWQFKHRYVYKDGTKSAFSPLSKIAIPKLALAENQDKNSNNNYVKITFSTQHFNNTWNNFVERIEVAAREDNLSDSYIIEEIEDFESGGDIELLFYNNGVRKSINIDESNAIYSFVPLKAKSQELIDGNRITYGDFVEGYDNFSNDNLEIDDTLIFGVSPIYREEQPLIIEPGTAGIQSSTTQIPVDGGDTIDIPTITVSANDSNSGVYYFRFEFPGGVINGQDEVFIDTADWDQATFPDVRHWVIFTLNQWLNARRIVTLRPDGTIGSFGVGLESDTILVVTIEQENMYPIVAGQSVGANLVQAYVTGSAVEFEYSEPKLSLKRGGWHNFGLVYYDKSGRPGLVQTIDQAKMEVPYVSELKLMQEVKARVNIFHYPPEWAHAYQVVYGGDSAYFEDPAEGRGFLQFVVDGHTETNNENEMTFNISNIIQFNEDDEKTNVSYNYTDGDRVRFIRRSDVPGGTVLSELPTPDDVIDAPIIKYDDSTGELTIRVNPGSDKGTTSDKRLIEIYSPLVSNTDSSYLEIGEVFPVINPGEGNRYHYGNNKSQVQNTLSTTILDLDFGNVWIRTRDMPFSNQASSARTEQLIEDSHFLDTYKSNDFSYGRLNVEDKDSGQIRRYASVRYSDVYIPDTNINGLGTFFGTSFIDYDKSHGSIQKMHSEDKSLILFQENKVGRSMVNETILRDNTGEVLVQKSDQVLSDIQYYSGEFGISDVPESFAVYGFAKYFVDKNRGAILRLSNDGITKISDYKMSDYWSDILRLTRDANSRVRILGSYNEANQEYIVSVGNAERTIRFNVPGIGTLSFTEQHIDAITWSFSEATNRWISQLSFLPEMMCEYGIDYMTFLDGVAWRHNVQASTNYCMFYNELYPSEVDVVFNQNPSNIKFFKALELESDQLWIAPEITNQFGQESELLTEDFKNIEGVWWAALLRDKNTPNVTLPLIEGDDMRGHELIVKLRNTSTDFSKLFSTGLKFEHSELTNR